MTRGQSILALSDRGVTGWESLKPTTPVLLNCNIVLYAATVVLDSSVGMRRACPTEIVTYTCTVNQGALLNWIVEPYVSGATRIRFLLSSTPTGSSVNCNSVASVQCEDFDFVATLTNAANPMTIMSGTGTVTVADMTSTLTFTATVRLNGTVVQCRGVTAEGFPMNNSTISVAGVSV